MSNETEKIVPVGQPRIVSHSDAAILTKMLGDEANEIASWYDANRNEIPRMVQQACQNEMRKLRTLADKLKDLMPDCPECAARLERYDDQSFVCPNDCGFFHKDSLANVAGLAPMPGQDVENHLDDQTK